EEEDDEEGKHESAQEALSGGRAAEGAGLRLECGVVAGVIAEPGAEGGARDGVVACVLALRGVLGLTEMVVGLGDGVAGPEGGPWARGGLVTRVAESHGSCPWVNCGKDTVGKRAWLVQWAAPAAPGASKGLHLLPAQAKLANATNTASSWYRTTPRS